MNGFEKRAHGIKQKIMATTMEMLRTTGPGGIRIADIAKQAKVSQVTIYNYFGSKESLLRDVFKDYIEKAVREYEAYMEGSHTLKEKIEYILFLEKESYKEFPPGVIKEMVSADPELARYVEEIYEKITIPLTVKIIQEGKASGEISEHISIETVLAFIQLYMNQYAVILDMAEKSGKVDEFLEGMVHMFFYGVCGKS